MWSITVRVSRPTETLPQVVIKGQPPLGGLVDFVATKAKIGGGSNVGGFNLTPSMSGHLRPQFEDGETPPAELRVPPAQGWKRCCGTQHRPLLGSAPVGVTLHLPTLLQPPMADEQATDAIRRFGVVLANAKIDGPNFGGLGDNMPKKNGRPRKPTRAALRRAFSEGKKAAPVGVICLSLRHRRLVSYDLRMTHAGSHRLIPISMTNL